MLKRCCGTGAIDNEQLKEMISNVEISNVEILRASTTDDIVGETLELEKKLGEVNVAVLEPIVDKYANSRAGRVFENNEFARYKVALFKILNALDWTKVMPKMEELNWKDCAKLVPTDVDFEGQSRDAETDGGLTGELKSIAGFSIESLGLFVPFQEERSQQPRQITQNEINDIILRTKQGVDLTDIQKKQMKVLDDLNKFVWQQKPREKGTKRREVLETFYKFLGLSHNTTLSRKRRAAVDKFREKYTQAKPQRDALLEKNKEEFRNENASHLLTDALAERVMNLVAAQVAAIAQSQAPSSSPDAGGTGVEGATGAP